MIHHRSINRTMNKIALTVLVSLTVAGSAGIAWADTDEDIDQLKSDLDDIKTQLQDIQDELDPPVYAPAEKHAPNFILVPVDPPRVVSEAEKNATKIWMNQKMEDKPYPWQYPHETMPSYQARLAAWENGETQPKPETTEDWLRAHSRAKQTNNRK